MSIIDPQDEQARDRALRFATAMRRTIKGQLGSGNDGIVLDTTSRTCIKALKFDRLYTNERDVYLRLRKEQVHSICGLTVPQLLRHNDDLWVLEMDFVSPPYVLDFACARLDSPPDYPGYVMAQWRQEKAEQFEEDWPMVQEIIRAFRSYGIYLTDLNHKNINLGHLRKANPYE